MKFFTEDQKMLAYGMSARYLHKNYKKSERDLKTAARSGNEFELAKVMKRHGDFEYAMLFRETPEFKNRRVIKHA